ncbi:hypothetical protein FIBSPDRAFT_876977 [Athelia psychrophila]|uniref:Uncharacterized protein n=1 Tax=Athelia psychrophila TaxID=1759441 RepID=A0A167WC96_9AGAM|nr:hypothetical protein FIBSPDRAFT_876977 [Fibularhizoctonia sp. CBS 109695]
MITVRYLAEMPACFLFVLYTCNGILNKSKTTKSVSPCATISPQCNLSVTVSSKRHGGIGVVPPCSISLI